VSRLRRLGGLCHAGKNALNEAAVAPLWGFERLLPRRAAPRHAVDGPGREVERQQGGRIRGIRGTDPASESRAGPSQLDR